jgi:hypothetical protein
VWGAMLRIALWLLGVKVRRTVLLVAVASVATYAATSHSARVVLHMHRIIVAVAVHCGRSWA